MTGLFSDAPLLPSAECGLQLRQQFEQVPNQPDIRDFEDRGLGVLVDRHDRAGVLDAGQVLDGAGDADGDVQVGGDSKFISTTQSLAVRQP